MPKVVISGYYGFNNIGDEAILKGMIDAIKNLSSDAEIVVLSQHPEFTAKKHEVKSVRRMGLFNLIKEIKNCDLLVSGGGSLFQDVTSKRSILYYLGIIYLAKILGKKIMIYGQGIGPINISYNRFLMKHIFNSVNFINVRDEKSKMELIDMGVTKDILVTVDTVFGIKEPSIDVGAQILRVLNIDKGKKIIGISIRPWHNTKVIINEIKKLSEELAQNYDYDILFIPCHFYSDLKIMKEIERNIDKKFKHKIHVLDRYLYVNEYLSLVGNLEFMIGMRLHALIFSVLMSIPVIGLSYDPKIINFLSMIGKNNILNIANINYKDIIEQVEDLIANFDIEKNIVIKKKLELKKLANVHNEVLIKLLNNEME